MDRAQHPRPGVSPDPLLRLDQVSLRTRLAQRPILQDLCFSVQAGARVALVGPSGAGKTSLLRLLNRLSDPSDGVIYLGGQDLRQLPIQPLRQRVALVQQETKLLQATVRQSLLYPLQLRQLPEREQTARLQAWLSPLDLDADLLERSEPQLSLGQRQRVGLARALISEPTLLLLDEPTAALDAAHSQQLLTLLLGLAQTEGTTVILASHQVALAQNFCTQLIELRDGKLAQDTPAAAVDWPKTSERLASLATSRDWDDLEA